MPEVVANINQESAHPLVAPEAAYAGGLLVANANNLATHTLLIDGQAMTSTLPEGLNPFQQDERPAPAQGPLSRNLSPNKLDDIPVGTFEISGEGQFPGEWGGPAVTYPVSRKITMYQTAHGKAISSESLKSDMVPQISFRGNNVLAALGFIIESDEPNGPMRVKGVPTPATFKEAAKALNVDVALVEDAGQLSPQEYLKYYADGQYPVSTAEPYYYKHDTEDDHAPAIVLGAKPLRDALAVVARDALNGTVEDAKDATENIDKFTATLNAVVGNTVIISGEAYGERMGRETYMRRAQQLGIKPETAGLILQTAQQNAALFGMRVKNLA